jgi:hypothetical protein
VLTKRYFVRVARGQYKGLVCSQILIRLAKVVEAGPQLQEDALISLIMLAKVIPKETMTGQNIPSSVLKSQVLQRRHPD